MAWTHQGDSTFAVWLYPSSGSGDLAINEIGAYDGRVVIDGPALIAVPANGPWSARK